LRELFIPLFSFLCRDGTRWAEARSNQCGHLAPPGSALSYARCTARPDRHFQTALVESCQKAVCGRALSQQSSLRRRLDAATRRHWQPLVSACFATSNFAGLGHSREIIHEEDYEDSSVVNQEAYLDYTCSSDVMNSQQSSRIITENLELSITALRKDEERNRL